MFITAFEKPRKTLMGAASKGKLKEKQEAASADSGQEEKIQPTEERVCARARREIHTRQELSTGRAGARDAALPLPVSL